MARTPKTAEFIEKLEKIHQGRNFDFSRVEYINSKTKVSVICPEHGEFQSRPDTLLSGFGCSKCSGRKRLSSREFIERAEQKHPGKYDFSKTVYVNRRTPVTVTCPVHGDFSIDPQSLLKGFGCTKCSGWKGRKLNTKTFISRSKKVHGNQYDYSKVNYSSHKESVLIICPKHGEFLQSAHDHLDGHGCPSCSRSQGERIIENFLKENSIGFEVEKKIGNDSYRFDFFIPELSLLIEFDGEQHFKENWFHKKGGRITFEQQQLRDEAKDELAKSLGLSLLRIPFWEMERIESILRELFNRPKEINSLLEEHSLEKNRRKFKSLRLAA